MVTYCMLTLPGYTVSVSILWTFDHVGLCTYVYTYIHTKNRQFSAFLLENIQLSVFYYFLTEFKHLQSGLLRPASYAIHAFPNKMQRPLAPGIFYS